MGDEIIFREVQRPRHWYYWAFLAFLILVTWSMAILQLLLGITVGSNPASDLEMVIILVLAGVAFPAFLLSVELVVEVRADGLFVRFRPFHFRFINIPLDEVIDVQTVTYSPLGDFGGWGIRYGKDAKAYTINGNRGIRLFRMDGHDLVIGSQRPEEMEMAIRRIRRGGAPRV
jgi:hypothetical protein